MSDGLRAKYGWSLSDVNIIGSAGLAALYVTYMIIGPLFDKYGVTITMYTAIFTEDIPLTTVADKPIRPNENTQLLNNEEIFMTPLQILTSPKFWIYETLMVLTQGLTFMQNVNIIIRSSASQNANPNDLITGTTLQLTIVSIFQSIGRVGAGTISDIVLAKGIDRSILLIFAQGIIFVGHLLLGVADTSLLSLDVYLALCSALIGLGFGGNGALFPLLTRGMFGSKYYGTASSYVMIGVPVGFITSNLIFGLVYDNQLSYQRSTGGPSDYCYGKQCLQTSFIIAIVTQFISFALSILLYVMLQKRR
ncbi:hypothetical protein HDV04_000919 [Boothiomyces sp. JEL0838]|nr:hypothetical protein HDV04_000870 [Boothiomyces sp. JEL0838]KAJ3314196.1 hypothetical protein HDV04_000919 [Boothiomyces sp. JEL0838]